MLFIAVDDLKDWVNCLGGYEGVVHTPNIDRLANQATLFSNAHCPSPKCGPSRASILTGRRPSSTGIYDNGHWWYPHQPEVKTIPAYFREHGYRVAGAGKIFHHTAGFNPPNQWDDFRRLTFTNDPWFRGVELNYPWSQTSPFPQGFPFSGVAGLGHENDWGVVPKDSSQHDDQLSVDYAVSFLNQKHTQPFFLACGLFRPHLPWYVPQRFFDLYPLESIVLPEIAKDDLADVPEAGQRLAADRRGDFETIRRANAWRLAVRAYLASISFVDAMVGQLLAALHQSPYADNTLVVLWSDHGWHLGEKDHWHKSTLWEESTRVPFIIQSPSIKSGICRQPVSLINLFPTLIELCQLPPLSGLDGVSLLPLLVEKDRNWTRPAITEFRKGNVALRTHRYRYIRYADGGEELYDHHSDAYEWKNLAGDDRYREVVERLRRQSEYQWAPVAPGKSAYLFDPLSYSWTQKKTGRVIFGRDG